MDASGVRTLAAGRCFVYLLPCRDEDTQKIGYARDPWARLQAFHPRFDRFFDLGRGVLIEADRVREARLIETELKTAFAEAATPAPLVVRTRAGGRFEWFRGVHAAALDRLAILSARLGYPLHAPLDAWLCAQWMGQAERLADWSRHAFAAVELLHHNAPAPFAAPRERALRERFALWEGIGIDLDVLLPGPIRHWDRHGFD